MRRNVARVFVALDDELGIVGFYSLSSYTLAIDDVPEQIPAGCRATMRSRQRALVASRGTCGCAGKASACCCWRMPCALSAGRSVTIFAIVVDDEDDAAATFYRRFGFQPFPLWPHQLFLLRSTAATALERA